MGEVRGSWLFGWKYELRCVYAAFACTAHIIGSLGALQVALSCYALHIFTPHTY